MSRLVSLIILVVLIVAVGLSFYSLIVPYILPLSLAAVTVMLSEPLFQRFLKITGQRRAVAAAATTVSLLAIVLVPILVGTAIAASQLFTLATTGADDPNWKKTIDYIKAELSRPDHVAAVIENWTGNKVDPDELSLQLQARLQTVGKSLAKRTTDLLSDIPAWGLAGLMYLVAIYYFFLDGQSFVRLTEELVPMDVERRRGLIRQFEQAVRGVVLATFAAAFSQGLATGIGMWVCGFRNFMILTLLATIMSLVPLMGTWLIWGPAAIWLWWDGHYAWAIGLTVYGVVFIGLLDNVIRTYVLNSSVELHPLLAFVSVMGGLQVMGLWGVFIGPIIASCFYALLQSFNAELSEWNKVERNPTGLPPGNPLEESKRDANLADVAAVSTTGATAGSSAAAAADSTNVANVTNLANGPTTTPKQPSSTQSAGSKRK